ncbi:MAG: right-handed parallel beta-helix repeat-containing protein [Paludibacter sp.]|nr:right-handed parallel beta-helix repeat-containing protein [Paludibacter sp.]
MKHLLIISLIFIAFSLPAQDIKLPAGQSITVTALPDIRVDSLNYIVTNLRSAIIDLNASISQKNVQIESINRLTVSQAAQIMELQTKLANCGTPVPPVPKIHADYFVAPAPNGNDNNPGSLEKPFLTISRGIAVAIPGDTIMIRAGTYMPFTITKDGSAGKLYHLLAYPGERVIINGSGITTAGVRTAFIMNGADYWHLKNIEIINVTQYSSANQSFGLRATNVMHCIFEELVIHNIQGPGFGLYGSSGYNQVLNCDSYDNFDPLTTRPGDDADGFSVGRCTGDSNIFRGCRAWNNSDDGIDTYGTNGNVLIEGNWTFNNGNHSGNGQGIKLGVTSDVNAIRRIVRNNLSAFNKSGGFDQSEAQCILAFYNNVAYRNSARGWWLHLYMKPHVMRYNIAYGNTNYFNGNTNIIHSNNSWDSAVVLTDLDFVNITFENLTKPRVKGKLPELIYKTLMH